MSMTASPDEETPAAPAAAPAAATFSFASFLKRLSSVKLAIVLMLLIALASVLGTVVPQGDASVITALESSETTKRLLLGLGANNVFYSWWFLVLLALFFLNLLVSTWTMVIPRLKVGLRKPPEVSVSVQERHHEDPIRLPAQSLDAVAVALKRAGYRFYPAKNGGIVAHKGRFSRFSPLVTHVGLFVILLGAMFTGLTTFKASVPLMAGETLPASQMVREMAKTRGVFARGNYDWSVRLDKFWMDYYSEDRVKQFYSELSILDKDGHVLDHKKIWVNEPMIHEGVWFYQAFWGVGGVDVVLAGAPKRYNLEPGDGFGIKGWLSKRETIGAHEYMFYLPNERSAMYVMHFDGVQKRPMPIATLTPGQSTQIEGKELIYKGPAFYSGLQSKSDPGIPVVYAGFLIVTIGTTLAFFGLRQLWVGPTEGGFILSGKANRGHFAFRRELVRIANELGAKLDE